MLNEQETLLLGSCEEARTLAAGDPAHLLRQVHLGVVDDRIAAAGQVGASLSCLNHMT